MISLILILVGALVFLASMYRVVRVLRVRHWQRVQGNIAGTAIKSRPYRLYPAARLDLYCPQVEYTYEVDGVPYSSNGISVDDYVYGTVDRTDVEHLLSRFDGPVDVFVDPRSPSSSVLDRRVSWKHLDRTVTVGVVGILLTLSGIAIVVLQP